MGRVIIDEYKNLVIQVTTFNKHVVEYFSEYIDLSNVELEEVSYSFEALKAEKEAIVDKMKSEDNELINRISGVGISFYDNAINLYIVGSDDNARSSDFRNKVKCEISSFENINIITTSGKDTTCATSVQPGAEISNSGSTRSVGFWAYKNGTLGIVTSPHNSISEGDTIRIGNVTFGTATTPYYSGAVDAVFIERTNADFLPTRTVSGWNINLTSGGYTTLAVGYTAYAKGKTTGGMTGQIIDTNYTTSYGISNCVVVNTACAGGDSGGIVAGDTSSSSRLVAGIITGKQGDTSNLIYVKAYNIVSTLGITLY